MSEQPAPDRQPGTVDRNAADDIVAAAETGARSPGPVVAKIICAILLAWAVFQVWVASPLPIVAAHFIPLLTNTHIRPAHLAFAIFLTYLIFPATKKSPRDHIPIQDWILAAAAAWCALYLAVFANAIAERPGLPTTADLVHSFLGLVLLLEAARRALGLPLVIVASVFLVYIFFGEYAPDVLRWKGASIDRAMSHLWLTQEGVFGVALGVSASLVFIFVLFGGLLEKGGAGNYFIQVSFALMGHFRGGPAKAAVVSSAMTGMISGSSIANVVTTGVFTIPLMRKVGFPAEKAGAVEVASSTNGQLMPPVMGAAAFLMVEYVGVSYVDVIKHAFLPAVISYIALVYIVHLEAVKAGMRGLPRLSKPTLAQRAVIWTTVPVGMIVLGAAIYYGFGWTKQAVGDATPWIAAAVLIAAYVALVRYAADYKELGIMESVDVLPETGPTMKSGLYYLLPVGLLMWCLLVERFSPGLSAFWAVVLKVFMLLTQRPLQSHFRGTGIGPEKWRESFNNLIEGMINGARNMVGIGVATAAAGIIVGAVTLTPISQVITEAMEILSGGNLLVLLVLTAISCIVLGMGLPTTANYIVVSSLMAQVIVTVGASNGLIVPLIAVHLFVFYFGILADDTPPVGLAAYAAAAISGGDPIKTGIQGFTYDIRTAVLPFMFIFNTELLMIGIEGPFHLILVIVTAVIAVLLFAAATQGFFLVKSKAWETAALLLVAFTLFRPGFWMDMIVPPLESVPATKIEEVAAKLPAGEQIRLRVTGQTLEGDDVDKTVMLPMGPKAPGVERLRFAGLELRDEGGKKLVDVVVFGSAAEKQKIDFDWEIVSVEREADRLPKHIMYIPALALLALVIFLQKGRQRRAVLA
ncbi:MAG: C4-dicarboxylate ABC transporter [Rhodospirillales bacterium CG15_BIG_FIL_POST_REV_8_21_14_020_66_15]|nr:MAG: C4-dicarboxylate ABC transporter [Rhodospirillales bacterium CG15_BIG_FIL_POST_REV_8_21_14_020_66_15]